MFEWTVGEEWFYSACDMSEETQITSWEHLLVTPVNFLSL